jgi:hypothetical protein
MGKKEDDYEDYCSIGPLLPNGGLGLMPMKPKREGSNSARPSAPSLVSPPPNPRGTVSPQGIDVQVCLCLCREAVDASLAIPRSYACSCPCHSRPASTTHGVQ